MSSQTGQISREREGGERRGKGRGEGEGEEREREKEEGRERGGRGTLVNTLPSSRHYMQLLMNYLPVVPSQSLTDLSKDALAMSLASGEKHTWLTSCWCPEE